MMPRTMSAPATFSHHVAGHHVPAAGAVPAVLVNAQAEDVLHRQTRERQVVVD